MKQETMTTIGLAALLFAGSIRAQQPRQPEIDLQAAIRTQTVDGDLNAAIEQYEAIASNYGETNRAVAADALIRMADAYQKQGDAKAQETYERVVREFAAQAQYVAQARARLSALDVGAELGRTPTEATGPARRLVEDLLGGLRTLHVPTRDGRHITRFNDTVGSFELVELESGSVRQLTKPGLDLTPFAVAGNKLSPDGTLIAAMLVEVPYTENHGELRVFRVNEDGPGKTLSRWEEPEIAPRFFAWSPDQSQLWIYILSPEGASQIASVNVSDGSTEVLKTMSWHNTTQVPSLSPDGRFLVYHDADDRNAEPDIFILATDGSQEVRLENPAADRNPMFAPDGSGFVFLSNRNGGQDDL